MAQRIDGPFDFSRYNFAAYADGATWILTKGEDYTITCKALVDNAHKWAKAQGMSAQHKYLDTNPKAVALRFTKLDKGDNVTEIRVQPPVDEAAPSTMESHFAALVRDNPELAKQLLIRGSRMAKAGTHRRASSR